jgi:hypothetical protein
MTVVATGSAVPATHRVGLAYGPRRFQLDHGGLCGIGYLRRQWDPEDERQVLVSLTDTGRRLREKGLGMDLTQACGLTADEFPRMQKAVATLRNNLIKALRERV